MLLLDFSLKTQVQKPQNHVGALKHTLFGNSFLSRVRLGAPFACILHGCHLERSERSCELWSRCLALLDMTQL